jgi:hypothetical protein
MTGTLPAARLLVNRGGSRESFVNHIRRHNTGRGGNLRADEKGMGEMRGITIGIAATVAGTMAYVLIAVALASVG